MRVRCSFVHPTVLAIALGVPTWLTPAQCDGQTPGVSGNFGALPNDLLLNYGFQYKATPRASGPYSAAFLLPGSLSYNVGVHGSPLLTLRVDGTTLDSVEYPSNPRATGVGDSDIGATFIGFKEGLWAPKVTLDYQLNLPTGDATQKLGTGQYGHRFSLGLAKSHTDAWSYQAALGSLFTRKQPGYLYSNALFTSLAVTRNFTKKKSPNAEGGGPGFPTLKNEIDIVPPYSAVPQVDSASTPNKRSPTEIYSVSTFTVPLKWETKLSLVGRVGLTPFTPKCVLGVQLQHMFRHR